MQSSQYCHLEIGGYGRPPSSDWARDGALLDCLYVSIAHSPAQDVDAIPVQEDLSGVTPSDTIVACAPVRAGPNVLIVDAAGEILRSPEQKSTSRFAEFYHDLQEQSTGYEPSQEAYNARIPSEIGGFLRM